MQRSVRELENNCGIGVVRTVSASQAIHIVSLMYGNGDRSVCIEEDAN